MCFFVQIWLQQAQGSLIENLIFVFLLQTISISRALTTPRIVNFSDSLHRASHDLCLLDVSWQSNLNLATLLRSFWLAYIAVVDSLFIILCFRSHLLDLIARIFEENCGCIESGTSWHLLFLGVCRHAEPGHKCDSDANKCENQNGHKCEMQTGRNS